MASFDLGIKTKWIFFTVSFFYIQLKIDTENIQKALQFAKVTKPLGAHGTDTEFAKLPKC